jgi:hypothetical protein
MLLRLKASLKYFNLEEINKNTLEELDKKYPDNGIGKKAKRDFQKKEKKKERRLRRITKKEKERLLYKEKYHEYLLSPAWHEIRIEMLTAFPKCQRCDSKHSLQVHHKTYKNVFKEEPKDLEVLC